MFLFENPGLYAWLMLAAVFAALFVLNEISRRSQAGGFILFVLLPAALTIFVWPKTTVGTSVDTWFHNAKVYSALAGCVGFWAIRNFKVLSTNKIALSFPAFILAVNILEAVVRDFQIGGLALTRQVYDGMMMSSGPWNYMNGIAGILNIVTITGWLGIRISSRKSKDMLWPDMCWFWIVAYSLWNFAYVYNCLGDRSWYVGIALLAVPTVAAFTVGKGAWLQHRAHTLALWCMFAMTVPSFIDESIFAVKASQNPAVLFAVSFAALLSNLAVLAYMVYKIVRTRRNPYTGELYVDLGTYKSVAALAAVSEPGAKAAAVSA